MGSAPSSSPLDDVMALELEVQDAQCRASQSRLAEIFAPDFVEIGASSRRWDLDSTLQMLRDDAQDPDVAGIEVRDLRARYLTPDVIQVFWTSHRAGRRARRTSIWRRHQGQWQLVYHQGTPIPE